MLVVVVTQDRLPLIGQLAVRVLGVRHVRRQAVRRVPGERKQRPGRRAGDGHGRRTVVRGDDQRLRARGPGAVRDPERHVVAGGHARWGGERVRRIGRRTLGDRRPVVEIPQVAEREPFGIRGAATGELHGQRAGPVRRVRRRDRGRRLIPTADIIDLEQAIVEEDVIQLPGEGVRAHVHHAREAGRKVAHAGRLVVHVEGQVLDPAVPQIPEKIRVLVGARKIGARIERSADRTVAAELRPRQWRAGRPDIDHRRRRTAERAGAGGPGPVLPVHYRAGMHEPRGRRRNLHAGVTGVGPRRRGERGLHDQITEAKERLGTAAGANERVRRILIDGIEVTVRGGRFQPFEHGPAEILPRPGHEVGLLPQVVADVPDRKLAGVAVRRIVAPGSRALRHPERIAQPQRPHPRPGGPRMGRVVKRIAGDAVARQRVQSEDLAGERIDHLRSERAHIFFRRDNALAQAIYVVGLGIAAGVGEACAIPTRRQERAVLAEGQGPHAMREVQDRAARTGSFAQQDRPTRRVDTAKPV